MLQFSEQRDRISLIGAEAIMGDATSNAGGVCHRTNRKRLAKRSATYSTISGRICRPIRLGKMARENVGAPKERFLVASTGQVRLPFLLQEGFPYAKAQSIRDR